MSAHTPVSKLMFAKSMTRVYKGRPAAGEPPKFVEPEMQMPPANLGKLANINRIEATTAKARQEKNK
jgi:hypothetical protein